VLALKAELISAIAGLQMEKVLLLFKRQIILLLISMPYC
jgi:hypothetical protein